VHDDGGHKAGVIAEKRVGSDDEVVVLIGILAHVLNEPIKHRLKAQFAVCRTVEIHALDALTVSIHRGNSSPQFSRSVEQMTEFLVDQPGHD
jgi:hypothetical protein